MECDEENSSRNEESNQRSTEVTTYPGVMTRGIARRLKNAVQNPRMNKNNEQERSYIRMTPAQQYYALAPPPTPTIHENEKASEEHEEGVSDMEEQRRSPEFVTQRQNRQQTPFPSTNEDLEDNYFESLYFPPSALLKHRSATGEVSRILREKGLSKRASVSMGEITEASRTRARQANTSEQMSFTPNSTPRDTGPSTSTPINTQPRSIVRRRRPATIFQRKTPRVSKLPNWLKVNFNNKRYEN